ncbi:MAG: Cd(II)/Pb(II)-responsive transcriptional regulator [Pseudomonadota bacterium]
MKIGELAHAAGTQSETIRYYERAGLLPEAARTEANYRDYHPIHIQRLAFIRHCRSLDMTLEEIRTLLQFKDAPEENCERVNALLDEHIGHVATRINELKILQKDLKALREQCTTDRIASECGILNHLEEAARLTPEQNIDRNHSVHVHGVHQRVGSAVVANPKIRKRH